MNSGPSHVMAPEPERWPLPWRVDAARAAFVNGSRPSTQKPSGSLRIIGWLTFVLWTLTPLGALWPGSSPAEVPDSPSGRGGGDPADQLKRFLTNPPVISELLYSYELPRLSQTNHYFLRSQPGAFLVAETATDLGHDRPADLDRYGRIFARFENRYWQKVDTVLTVWINFAGDRVLTNTILATADNYHRGVLPKVLNLGVGMVYPGAIRWEQDRLTATNPATGFTVEGWLERDDQGRAHRIHLLSTNVARGVGGASTIVYHYETPLELPFLPSRIESIPAAPTSPLAYVLRIHSLTTTPSPLEETAYALRPEQFPTLEGLSTWGDGVFITRWADGQVVERADPLVEAPNRTKVRGVFLFVLLLLLMSPLIWWGWRKAF